ncbi:unnamed protein product, partial [Strongylus vulgaris]
MKPKEGEFGLEIVADKDGKFGGLGEHPIPPSKTSSLELTTSTPLLTVTLPGVVSTLGVSTLGGASAVTTSIPIIEIPVHKTSEVPAITTNATTTTFTHATDSDGIAVTGEEQVGKGSTMPTVTTPEASGEEPKTTSGTKDSTHRPDILHTQARSKLREDEDLLVQNTTFSAFTDIIGEVELTGEDKATPS